MILKGKLGNGLITTGACDPTMVGHTKVDNGKNPNAGDTSIYIDGARSFTTDIKVSFFRSAGTPLETYAVTQSVALKNHLHHKRLIFSKIFRKILDNPSKLP